MTCLHASLLNSQHLVLLSALTMNGSLVPTCTQDVLQELWNVLSAKNGLWTLRLMCILSRAREVKQSICRGMSNVCIKSSDA